MKILVQKFRVNDLIDSEGKQIEFSKDNFNELINNKSINEKISLIYKSDDKNNNTELKVICRYIPDKVNYKIYQLENNQTLKSFFRDTLGLSLENNSNDYFTLSYLRDNKFEFSYIKHDTPLGQYFSSMKLEGKIIGVNNNELDCISIDKPHNRIIFGAPGTGKSHSLEQERENNFADDCYERVTFHPNSSYAQFVGTYKPTMTVKETDSSLTDEQKQILSILKDKNLSGQEKYDLLYDKFRDDSDLTRLPLLIGIYSDDEFRTKKADGSYTANDNGVERNHGRAVRPYINLNLDCVKEEITYEYIPGPFMRIYVAAKQNPSQDFLLLIEEINRANVAAVFGDVFQLLDRDENGNSEYPVAASEDIKKYLAKNGIHEDELKIPSNMYIWATMNSADQGVLPMDAAFKRRWDFEYIGIDDNENWDYVIPLPKEGSINWNVLRKAINAKLKTISGVNEDKLLGPYFLSKSVLEHINGNTNKEEIEKFINTFKSKVLMYLFEDVCKMRPTDLFTNIIDLEEGQTRPHYSDICKSFDKNGIEIFGFKQSEIEGKYKKNSHTVIEDSSAEQ